MPVGHCVHDAALVELEYQPTGQSVHVVSATTEHEALLYVPAAHVVQVVHDVAPAADQLVPAEHSEHTVSAVVEHAVDA